MNNEVWLSSTETVFFTKDMQLCLGYRSVEVTPWGLEMVNKMPGEHQHGALPLGLSDPTNAWASDVVGGTMTFLMVLLNLGLWDTSPSPPVFVWIRCESFYLPHSRMVLGSVEHCFYCHDKLLTPE